MWRKAEAVVWEREIEHHHTPREREHLGDPDACCGVDSSTRLATVSQQTPLVIDSVRVGCVCRVSKPHTHTLLSSHPVSPPVCCLLAVGRPRRENNPRPVDASLINLSVHASNHRPKCQPRHVPRAERGRRRDLLVDCNED